MVTMMTMISKVFLFLPQWLLLSLVFQLYITAYAVVEAYAKSVIKAQVNKAVSNIFVRARYFV